MENGDADKAEPQRDEVLRLLKLLDQEIHQARRSKRKIERDLGMGQGYLGSVIKGRITLKVEHVYELGEALGREPLTLFYESASRENQERFLRDLGLAPIQGGDPGSVPELPPPMTREEIEELIRKVVRQELARLATS